MFDRICHLGGILPIWARFCHFCQIWPDCAILARFGQIVPFLPDLDIFARLGHFCQNYYFFHIFSPAVLPKSLNPSCANQGSILPLKMNVFWTQTPWSQLERTVIFEKMSFSKKVEKMTILVKMCQNEQKCAKMSENVPK